MNKAETSEEETKVENLNSAAIRSVSLNFFVVL